MKLFAVFFLLASGLSASSVEPWVGGTRPYETVSCLEMNIQGLSELGPTHKGGLRLDGGILDHWSVQGSWLRDDAAAGFQDWSLGSQWRAGEEGGHLLDTAIFAEGGQELGGDGTSKITFKTGMVLARELSGHSLNAQLAYGSADGLAATLAYRSPYLLYATRAGFEAEWGFDSSAIVPQIAFFLPGDISLQCGAKIGLPAAPTFWLLSLSYEIFPSP